MTIIDDVKLTQDLIRCPSITPIEGGALNLLQGILESLEFNCQRLKFEDVDNLYARFGDKQPNFCFAGHTDVVPVGDEESWSFKPFSGDIINNEICGRGAVDMKGGIAAFISALSKFLNDNKNFNGSISLLITGDEEGIAINGTKKVLEWMADNDEKIDYCIVGEPTNPNILGEMVKIGRRGSLNGEITVIGTQGHVAYPHLADNPIPKITKIISKLIEFKLDNGSEYFQPSNLEITSIDVGNPTTNVIPETATAKFNIRFNDIHSGNSLSDKIRSELDSLDIDYSLDIRISGESFVTDDLKLQKLISEAIYEVTEIKTDLSTTGGTSDARFITNYCPVIEFGLTGQTMHKVDERINIDDLQTLTSIYSKILDKFFIN